MTQHADLAATLALTLVAQPEASISPAAPAATPPATGGADMMGGPASTVAPGSTSAPGTVAPGTPTRPPGLFDGPMGMITIFMIGMLVFMLFTSARRQKREAAKRQDMMNSLRKGDKVQTVAGIRGTIDENPDGKDEVMLIVDPIARTRIRFAKSAITQVEREGAAAATVEAKSTESATAGA